ncbi:hypothetical protein GGR54DRAFT_634131 [Hypoxylon sp. NC1633]|nr:hypothetical protein GGR54DRAFT_634131 [Hypoxylon sp. NC1633]
MDVDVIGVSIRRFISPRRVEDEYADRFSVDTDGLGHQTVRKDAVSYKRRTYSTNKKRGPPIIRSRSPLCSISSKEDRSQESLQLSSSATSYGGDEFPPQLPPKSHARSSEFLKHKKAESSVSTIDLPEALFPRLENKATRSKQYLRRRESHSSISDDIQQLIQEADEAFKAVGSALVEVQIAESTFKDLPKLPTPDSSPILKPAPLATASRMQNPQLKRKKSKKSKKAKPMKPHRKSTAVKPAAKSGPRWTLSDNVTELFSGKLFHRIEVDEMLTPSQLEAYRLRRESIMQSEKSASEKSSAKSTETLDAESSDTPIEPFHLEDLSSRIGSAGVNITDDASSDDTPIAPTFAPVVRQDFSIEEDSDEDLYPGRLSTAASQIDIGEGPAEYRNATFLTPPMRNPARFGMRNQRSVMPSIPETSAVAAPEEEPFQGQSFGGSQDIVADSNYVFLQSSPYSITSSRFRHGPIRLAKLDLMPDIKVGADDGLDWTAFQMAISGGAGDWFSESDDVVRHREAEEADELADWFRSLNFNGVGGLVSQDFEMPSPTSTTSGEDYSDVSYTEIEKDNPYSPHHQWQHHLRRRGIPEGHQLNLDMSGLELDTSKMRLDEHGRSYRESYHSLPQSPMLDLRVIRTPEGDDMDVVPMGYNLGHDLGDFLKWEAEHAYAGDFS